MINFSKVTSLQNTHPYASINQSVTIQGDLMISSGLENMTLKENSSALRMWATLFVYWRWVQYGKTSCAVFALHLVGAGIQNWKQNNPTTCGCFLAWSFGFLKKHNNHSRKVNCSGFRANCRTSNLQRHTKLIISIEPSFCELFGREANCLLEGELKPNKGAV